MLGRFTFIMALRMMGTLVAWWVYELTGDPFAIGLVGLSEVIPALSMALYAGHVIDKSEKRKLVLRGVSFIFLAAAVLLFFSTPYVGDHFSNYTIAIGIYTVIFCTGIIRAFTGPQHWPCWPVLYQDNIYKMPLPGTRKLAFGLCYGPCYGWLSYLETWYHRYTHHCLFIIGCCIFSTDTIKTQTTHATK